MSNARIDGPTLELGTNLGNFRLMDLLGEGGMGLVYLAEDLLLGRKVALKVMQPHIARLGKTRDRFLREARVAAQVEHERIVRIYQVDEDRGVPFIAMELLQGESLDARLKRESIPPLKVTFKVSIQTAQGLAIAHRKGLIHRDIKPSNVWLEPADTRTGFVCKILDFGLARATEGDEISTQSGKMMGTPAYMSPEQWRGKDVDYRTDIFSLGVMMYQMTTSKFPFGSGNHLEIARAVALDDPVPPIEQNPMIPKILSDLIMKMMEKDKEKRVSRAEEVISGLESYAAAREREAQSGSYPEMNLGEPRESEELRLLRDAKQKAEAELQQLREAKQIAEAELKQIRPISVPKPLGESAPKPPPAVESKRPPSSSEVKPISRGGSSLRPLAEDTPKIGIGTGTGTGSVAPKEEPKRPSGMIRVPESIRRTSSRVPLLDCSGPRGVSERTAKAVQKEWALSLGVPLETFVDLGDGVRMEFVLVPPGKFIVGSPKSERDRRDWEPETEVILSKPYYMGKYPVTQEEYEQLTGFNPSYHKGPVVALTDTRRFPVEKVSWPEAKLFCDLLSKKLLPKNFRLAKLPTELEWEYASRGGTRTPFSFGDLLNGIEANCDGSNPYGTESKGPYLKRPRDVGSYRPNPFGLFDMHGNVWEWCEDGWDEKAYEKKRGSDVQIEPANDRRILRGGSWSSAAKLCRSAHREWFVGSYRDNTYGFRVLLRYGEA